MKLKKIVAVAACGLAVLTASTFSLPRHVSVERSALLNASPEAILALAASNEGYQAFNPYRSMDPALTIEPFGPSSGVGSGFHFSGKDGTGRQTVASVTPDRVSYDVDLGPLGQPKQFISTQALPQGAQVTWRLEADMGFNPVFRVMGLFMDSMVGPTFELGLENLGKAAA